MVLISQNKLHLLNKLLPLLVFSILLLVPVGSQKAFATTFIISDVANGGNCEDVGLGGSWVSSTKTCVVSTPTNLADGDTVAVFANTRLEVSSSASLLITGNAVDFSGNLNVQSQGEVLNKGTISLIGGDGQSSGRLLNSGTVNNECTGNISLVKGTGPSSGVFVNLGIVNNAGITSQIFGGTVNDLTDSCLVGGELIPIEQTSLLLAGTQSFSWMIPVVLSVIGIGLFVVSRKSENS